jgi:dTDP-4-amino-4,6-dideoxygalactose transaminase
MTFSPSQINSICKWAIVCIVARIPFNRPTIAPMQASYVNEAFQSGHWSGDGPFTRKASEALSSLHGGSKVLLTTSCTAALELSALLLDLQPGDEVIVPSFTFVSSANAFVIMGATIVFAEVERETLSISARTVEHLITSRTRAIVAVNYGGAPSVTQELVGLAASHNIMIVEDNAHGLFGFHEEKALGTQSALSTLSFHETKNITCGEGGALVINDPKLIERAEIIREKGTNRTQFFRGMIDKYTWVEKGSSYLMSDINAAVLLSQLEFAETIQQRRREAFTLYMDGLKEWAKSIGATLPTHLQRYDQPFHMFPIMMPNLESRSKLIDHAKNKAVSLTFHYIPLHDSVGGKNFGRFADDFSNTQKISDVLVRLPLFSDVNEVDSSRVLEVLLEFGLTS